MRILRQPSTYGELHDMVAMQKLGGGVIRGLVGERSGQKNNNAFVRAMDACTLIRFVPQTLLNLPER